MGNIYHSVDERTAKVRSRESNMSRQTDRLCVCNFDDDNVLTTKVVDKGT